MYVWMNGFCIMCSNRSSLHIQTWSFHCTTRRIIFVCPASGGLQFYSWLWLDCQGQRSIFLHDWKDGFMPCLYLVVVVAGMYMYVSYILHIPFISMPTVVEFRGVESRGLRFLTNYINLVKSMHGWLKIMNFWSHFDVIKQLS